VQNISQRQLTTVSYIDIAQTLASYIAGNSRNGSIFAKITYNDKHHDVYTFKFSNTPYSLDLSRILIITTRRTASASEALINSLKPFINVVTIGDTTNGKPVGMNGWPTGKKYYAWTVTFKMVNANNEGDYYKGFAPARVLPDDITHDFSDREELCLKEAIYYLENGSVSTKAFQVFKRYPVYSEKPEWMNNAFIKLSYPK
jgi:carboxyl-terminal processing protease